MFSRVNQHQKTLRSYKKWCIVFSIMLFIIFVIFIYYNKSTSKQIVARINGEPIYCYQINEMELSAKEMDEGISVSRDDLVTQAIRDLLVYQEAQKLNICITEDRLNTSIENLKSTSRPLYDLVIKKYGTEKSYKKSLKYNMLYMAVQQYTVHQGLAGQEYTDVEAYDYFEKHIDQLYDIAKIEIL